MHTFRTRIGLPALVAALLWPTAAPAAVHLWQIKEVFSNADGSVQFIELFDSFGGETVTSNTMLTTNSDGDIKQFSIDDDLMKPTDNRHWLFATSSFAALTGAVTPDLTLNSTPFFNPNATSITIQFTGSFDSITFSGAALPKNGVDSLTDTSLYGPTNLVSGVNSPTNLDNIAGSINLSTPTPTGDYNGDHTVNAADYVLWRNTLTQPASPAGSGADGDGDGMVDDGDYDFWRARFGNTVPGAAVGFGSSAVPEPTAGLTICWLVLASCRRRRRP